MEVLKCENLKKYYGNHENTVKALDGVDLSVEKENLLRLSVRQVLENRPCCICLAAWMSQPLERYL